MINIKINIIYDKYKYKLYNKYFFKKEFKSVDFNIVVFPNLVYSLKLSDCESS